MQQQSQQIQVKEVSHEECYCYSEIVILRLFLMSQGHVYNDKSGVFYILDPFVLHTILRLASAEIW